MSRTTLARAPPAPQPARVCILWPTRLSHGYRRIALEIHDTVPDIRDRHRFRRVRYRGPYYPSVRCRAGRSRQHHNRLLTRLVVSVTLQPVTFSESGNSSSCLFRRKPLLRVADKMPALLNGLTRNANTTVRKEKKRSDCQFACSFG